jgi:PAS domain S-box-containing protein
MNLTLSRKALMLVSIPLAFELVFVVSLGTLLHEVDYERAREAHAREVADLFNALMRVLLDRGSSLVYSYLSQNQVFHARFVAGRERALAIEAQIQNLVHDYPYERASVERCLALSVATNDHSEAALKAMRSGDAITTKKEWAKLQTSMEAFIDSSEHITMEQENIGLERKKSQAAYRQKLEYLLYAGVAFNILLAFLLAVHFNRGTARRFKVLIDNTYRLASNQSLIPPLQGNDEMAHLDHTFRQMSQSLDLARQKERAIVDNAIDIICSIDASLRFASVNPACQAILGCSPNEIVDTRVAEWIFADDKAKTMEVLQRTITEKSQGSFESKMIKSDGSAIDIAWSAQWSESEASLFCVLHDISARKQIDRMKQEFVAMVSHDLKTPLTSIQMVHGLLQGGAYGRLSQDGLERLAEAEENVQRLIALVNGLLALDKMDAGKLEISRMPTTVNAIVEPSVRAVTGFALQQGVEITVLPHTDMALVADRERLIQVLVNLLSNAVKFSTRGSSVAIKIAVADKKLEISVIDQGRGVPAQLKAAIFERFTQVTQSDERQKGGTGLGLAICKAIVEQHNGTIGVESEEGSGSIFWFSLPILDDRQRPQER